ncbi:MAG: hypothetical protein FD163_1750 [Hyphomonadaceae bacterium]|nr:MAG: hypothetical protein FD128_418 [Hyphomonadaceae bacterium]KAF0185053.1 MAG: hypothetical protein FD163_1750 [Hyphomonadaceae bacterium]
MTENFEVHNIDTAPEPSKLLLEAVKSKFGMVPNLFGVMANSPNLLKAYLSVAEIFSQGSFDATEQQIVLITASASNGCTYCVAAHSAIADMSGVKTEITNALRAGTKIADAKLEALRFLTQEIVETRGWPSEKAKADFFASGYAQEAFLEVVLGVALKTASNYMNHTTNTPLEAAFAKRAWAKPA